MSYATGTDIFFQELEERLLDETVRRSAAELDLLLADDFIEIGSSGSVFNKREVIEALSKEHAEIMRSTRDFVVRRLADDIVLVTYRSIKKATGTQERHALRSSVWTFIDGRWQMSFHQGTPTPSN